MLIVLISDSGGDGRGEDGRAHPRCRDGRPRQSRAHEEGGGCGRWALVGAAILLIAIFLLAEFAPCCEFEAHRMSARLRRPSDSMEASSLDGRRDDTASPTLATVCSPRTLATASAQFHGAGELPSRARLLVADTAGVGLVAEASQCAVLLAGRCTRAPIRPRWRGWPVGNRWMLVRVSGTPKPRGWLLLKVDPRASTTWTSVDLMVLMVVDAIEELPCGALEKLEDMPARRRWADA